MKAYQKRLKKFLLNFTKKALSTVVNSSSTGIQQPAQRFQISKLFTKMSKVRSTISLILWQMVQAMLKSQQHVQKPCSAMWQSLSMPKMNATKISSVKLWRYLLSIAKSQSSQTNTRTWKKAQVSLKSHQRMTPTTLMLLNASTPKVIICQWLMSWTMTAQWMNLRQNLRTWTALKRANKSLPNLMRWVNSLKSRKWSTVSVTLSVQVPLWNHVYQRNGLLKWMSWLKMPSLTKKQITRLNSSHHASMTLSHNGWKTFMTGWSHVNSGGDIKSLLGITQTARCTSAKQRQKVTVGHRILTFWIHGSHQLYGRFQPWGGQMRKPKTSSVTSQRQLSLRDMISSSSGSAAWFSKVWNLQTNAHLKTFSSTVWFGMKKAVKCRNR